MKRCPQSLLVGVIQPLTRRHEDDHRGNEGHVEIILDMSIFNPLFYIYMCPKVQNLHQRGMGGQVRARLNPNGGGVTKKAFVFEPFHKFSTINIILAFA